MKMLKSSNLCCVQLPMFTELAMHLQNQGFGSGSALIRINLSCWIRIGIQEGKNDPH